MRRLYRTGWVFLLGLAVACAEVPKETAKTSEAEPASPLPAPSPPVPVPVQPSCDCAMPYRIALLLPLSGPSKDIGNEALNGAMMGFYELHSPSKVELKLFDTRGTPEGTRVAAGHAMDYEADIMIGPIFSANVEVAGAIAWSEGVTLLALSNNRQVAGDNVKVLGGHLEAEAHRIMEMVLERGGRSSLFFAPDNAFGRRLGDEFERLRKTHPETVLDGVLFSEPATVDELTKTIREAALFEERSRNLVEILDAFKERWQAERDVSDALTHTVDMFDFSERWADLYPVSCRDEERPAPVPEVFRIGMKPAYDPEQPLSAYENARTCETEIPIPEIEEPDPLPAELAPVEDGLAPPGEMPGPMEEAITEPMENLVEAVTEAPTAEPTEAEPADQGVAEIESSGYPLPKPDIEVERAILKAAARRTLEEHFEEALREARFGVLTEIAACLTHLSEKAYEDERGVEAIARTFAKREVLGPPKVDTIILPLGGDQLRLAASLFDYYHVGPPHVMFLGTSQWDKTEKLEDEPSLQGGKWLSVTRPFSPKGRGRYEALYGAEPGYISALAYDAVRLAFDETRAGEPVRTAPANGSFIIGESGAFRIMDDGTNERVISIKKLGGNSGNGNGGFETSARTHDADKRISNAEDRLARMCLGSP